MAIFYHGSSVLFPRFDLSHVLEGDGKVKFGYGVYLTSSFKSAKMKRFSKIYAIAKYISAFFPLFLICVAIFIGIFISSTIFFQLLLASCASLNDVDPCEDEPKCKSAVELLKQ